MIDSYVEERRRYIAEIKKSFDQNETKMSQEGGRFHRGHSNCVQDTYLTEDAVMTDNAIFPFLRVRFLVSIVLFVLFLYGNFTGVTVESYTTKDMIQLITENDLYTNFKDYVMIQMQD